MANISGKMTASRIPTPPLAWEYPQAPNAKIAASSNKKRRARFMGCLDLILWIHNSITSQLVIGFLPFTDESDKITDLYWTRVCSRRSFTI